MLASSRRAVTILEDLLPQQRRFIQRKKTFTHSQLQPKELRQTFVRPSAGINRNHMLIQYARDGQVDKAIRFYASMRRFGFEPHAQAALSRSLLTAGRLQEATDIIKQLSEQQQQQQQQKNQKEQEEQEQDDEEDDDEKTQKKQTKKKVVEKVPHRVLDVAVRIYAEQPHESTLNMLSILLSRVDTQLSIHNVISHLCQLNLAAAALKCIEKAPLRPSRATIEILIWSLYSNGLKDEAQVLRENQSKWNDLRASHFDLRLKYAPLGNRSNAGDVSVLSLHQAEEFLSQLKSKSLKSNEQTFALLIERSDSSETALSLFKRMQLEGHAPTAQSYNALLDFDYFSGRLNEVLKVWQRMRDSEVKPTSRTHSILIATHYQLNNFDSVLDQLNHATRSGLSINNLSDYLLSLVLQKKDASFAKTIFESYLSSWGQPQLRNFRQFFTSVGFDQQAAAASTRIVKPPYVLSA